ncbi:hypothetical protein C8J57DRAFT_1073636, partial [Mycena rebaudengoi]
ALGVSLYNLGSKLRAVSRHGDAVRAGEEAAMLLRNLAEKNPTINKLVETDPAALERLGGSLVSLGDMLNITGPHDDALRINEEAVDVYQKLAGSNSKSQLGLAAVLDNLLLLGSLAESDPAGVAWGFHGFAVDLRRLDAHEDALGAEEEAVKLYRTLAQTHAKELITALELLAKDLRVLGREGDAERTEAEVAVLQGAGSI